MRKCVLACLVFVLLAGVYSFTPATAGSDSGILIAQAGSGSGAEPAAEPAKEEKKEEPKAPEGAKDEKKEEPKAAADEPPEKIMFESVGKMGVVEFPHKDHFEEEKIECKVCHEGDKPLFEKKITKTGMKMADMYAGKNCGFCHDGKDKHPFEAKKSCAKCHKKK